jgi:hypothetical protein
MVRDVFWAEAAAMATQIKKRKTTPNRCCRGPGEKAETIPTPDLEMKGRMS